MSLYQELARQTDFWAMLVPNLVLTLLINAVVDSYVAKVHFLSNVAHDAATSRAFFVFLAVTILVTTGVRQRQHRLIAAGDLRSFPRAWYNVLGPIGRVAMYSLRETRPCKREFHFFINFMLLGAVLYHGAREALARLALLDKLSFDGSGGLLCPVATEALWKGGVFSWIFTHQYAAAHFRGQDELRTVK